MPGNPGQTIQYTDRLTVLFFFAFYLPSLLDTSRYVFAQERSVYEHDIPLVL